MVQNSSSDRTVSGTEDRGPIRVATMVESIVGCKWSLRLLQHLADGCSRPSALLRTCSGLSAKVMNERLRKMLRFGILERTVLGEKPPVEVNYVLTPFGRRFVGILDEVRRLQEAVDSATMSGSGEFQKAAPRSGRLTRR